MNKIRQYFTTFVLTRGFFIALLSSAFIYLEHWGLSHPLIHTIFALSSLFLLLQSNTKVWFWFGVFTGALWFWWIALSLQHYGYAWGIPVGVSLIALGYGIIFWSIAKIASFITSSLPIHSTFFPILLKALGLLGLSYFHPFGFDWLKPELIFIQSYIGIEKWQYALVLIAIVFTQWRQNFSYLLLILLTYQPSAQTHIKENQTIALISTQTSVEDKWNTTLHPTQFKKLFKIIDTAIEENKTLIVLPESVFPTFINRSQQLMDTLKEKAKHISIVTGGLYWDGKTPRNSTYIFTHGKVTVANKVVLVPFGESNPLPDFLSKWVNDIFYDGAIDYEASTDVTDYQIDDKTYRNAICFEATSEKLYIGHPENMIVLSNNGWFHPSIEPTLQKLLLLYYNKKYGTTIYHSVNMSKSYVIKDGNVIQ